jgi:urocanate hydratase
MSENSNPGGDLLAKSGGLPIGAEPVMKNKIVTLTTASLLFKMIWPLLLAVVTIAAGWGTMSIKQDDLVTDIGTCQKITSRQDKDIIDLQISRTLMFEKLHTIDDALKEIKHTTNLLPEMQSDIAVLKERTK